MKEVRKPSNRSVQQFKFEKEREDWTDREIQIAQLYFLTLINDKTAGTKSNTSTMVWFLIVIPIISWLILWFVNSIN